MPKSQLQEQDADSHRPSAGFCMLVYPSPHVFLLNLSIYRLAAVYILCFLFHRPI